jgi:aspartate carbamoyltransferase catalytic subunit
MYQKNLISIDTVSTQEVKLIFKNADILQKSFQDKKPLDNLKGKILAALFYEPSSRTFSSFITAMQKLGGGIIPLNGMMNTSVYKGETLEDTARVFSSYADIIVIRHNEAGAAQTFSEYASVPVINAGDGAGEHPTQALLDSYTISKHFASFQDLTVGMIGDLLYGRTVHSLSKLLAKLGVKKFVFISPASLAMPNEIKDKINSLGGLVEVTDNLKTVVSRLDVIYTTRVQKERFSDLHEYERLKLSYVISEDLLKQAKKGAILMHPLPRVGEIVPKVDADPRAVYFREEIRNGLYIRAALLDLIVNK